MKKAQKPATAADIDPMIRQQLAAYLADKVTLEEFKDWVFSFCWDFQPQPDDLLGEVELILAEYTSGFGDEARIREFLRNALEETSQAAKPV